MMKTSREHHVEKKTGDQGLIPFLRPGQKAKAEYQIESRAKDIRLNTNSETRTEDP